MVHSVPQFRPLLSLPSADSGFTWTFCFLIPGPPKKVYRWTSHSTDFYFDTNSSGEPLLWKAAPIQFNELLEQSDGSLPELAVSVGMVQGDLIDVLKANDWLQGQEVEIALVNLSTLHDPGAKLAFTATVTSVAMTIEAATFKLSTEGLYEFFVPQRIMQPGTCFHQYGDASCGFLIDVLDPGLATLGQCAKTTVACRERGDLEVAAGMERQHPKRIGLYPGLIPPIGTPF